MAAEACPGSASSAAPLPPAAPLARGVGAAGSGAGGFCAVPVLRGDVERAGR